MNCAAGSARRRLHPQDKVNMSITLATAWPTLTARVDLLILRTTRLTRSNQTHLRTEVARLQAQSPTAPAAARLRPRPPQVSWAQARPPSLAAPQPRPAQFNVETAALIKCQWPALHSSTRRSEAEASRRTSNQKVGPLPSPFVTATVPPINSAEHSMVTLPHSVNLMALLMRSRST